jgi:hypothetical protein
MARFTPENAREMAARSMAARKATKIQRDAQAACPPLPAVPPADENQEGISVSCVRARLQTLDALMAKAKTDREWDNLSRAYDRLFRVWCTLTGTPGPGNRKPSEQKSGRPSFGPLGDIAEIENATVSPPDSSNGTQSG